MDNTITTKTKRAPICKDYMTFRFDCPPEFALAQFERLYHAKPVELFVDAANKSVKVGPIPDKRVVL